ncbi:hypothetical protein MIZ01_1134 [Sideroxyarcus emersonii]|uniref:Uncharacterized protein n=1 Tax=Sideroxyarcus emersonii TaxID=2764705 RepID=A0AAN1X9G7_9PROT|nr:tetratricopeptide repeat protein [Sideroxyarcus emersonii]BCK87356.1 hypothetical protein MIZ01_1134 [Sideroxyarcus emersonii]
MLAKANWAKSAMNGRSLKSPGASKPWNNRHSEQYAEWKITRKFISGISMKLLQVILLFSLSIVSCSTFAVEETYIREYTYQASEVDSKVSSRTLALQQVKTLLLQELGTHVSAIVSQQTSSDGMNLNKVDIETLSAGVVKIDILEEKWNGSEYYLKAQIKADPNDVLKAIDKMLDVQNKQQQIDRLNTALSKANAANKDAATSLKELRKKTEAALAENERLKNQFANINTAEEQQRIQATYTKNVNTVSAAELYRQGDLYYRQKDYSSAIKLYRESANLGNAVAQAALGFMYANGLGVPQDYMQAVHWFQESANQESAYGQANLGFMYDYGYGVKRDFTNAVYWYQKSADQGNSFGQHQLGFMYFSGHGVNQNYSEAVYWFQKSADQGFALGQYMLGNMYEYGQGVNQNNNKAAYWYQKASEQGNALAQMALGIAFEKGRGVQQDYSKAIYWYRKAAAQGAKYATKKLKELSQKAN